MNIQGGVTAAVKFVKKRGVQDITMVRTNYEELLKNPLNTVSQAFREQLQDLASGKAQAMSNIIDGLSSATHTPQQLLNVVQSITHPVEGMFNVLDAAVQALHAVPHVF